MGPPGRNMEAGGMWKHRQVVGVGKGQGWVRGVKQRKAGAGHVCPCGQELAPWGMGDRWEGRLGGAMQGGKDQAGRIGHGVGI